MANSWTLSVQEDLETGELVLQFPEELLDNLSWGEGTRLKWTVDPARPDQVVLSQVAE